MVAKVVVVVVVVVAKFFNKNFVRRKVDNTNIQTEIDIKQSKQVQLHNTNIQNSDTTIKTKQAKFSPGLSQLLLAVAFTITTKDCLSCQ